GSPVANVKVTGPQVLAGPSVANALVLAGTTPAVAAPGGMTGSLTVTAGPVLGPAASAIAVGTLDFGTREGRLFSASTASAFGLVVHAVVAGTDGLTVTGYTETSTVGLTNPGNTYTGP